MSYTVVNYLLDRLKELGIQHVFGVPGDYSFPLLNALELDSELTWTGSRSELNAAYAAEGYARLHGISAVIGTSGPGLMGVAAGLAGSYSEHVPVIGIFGHPPTHKPGAERILHHSLLNDFSGYERIYAEFTAAHTTLTDENACREIDRVLETCWAQKLPGFIQLPKDVGAVETDPPSAPLDLNPPTSDGQQLEIFMAHLLEKLAHAEKPAMLIDHLVGRYHLVPEVEAMAASAGIPYSVVYAGKSAFVDESKPLWLGNYMGAGDDPVGRRISEADVLLRLGLLETTTNIGDADSYRHPSRFVDLGIHDARIGSKIYPGVALAEVVARLTTELADRWPRTGTPRPTPPAFVPETGVALTQDRVMDGIDAFFEDGDLVVIDQGMCSAVAGMQLPPGAGVVSQFCWGAIGYAVPTAFGTLLAAPNRRQVIVTGDGGFQMSGQELSTILMHGLAPIVILLNNQTMLIENVSNPGHDPQGYNLLPSWDYAKLPGVFKADGDVLALRVSTEDELDAAFHDAAKAHSEGRAAVIEVVTGPHDVASRLLYIFTTFERASGAVT